MKPALVPDRFECQWGVRGVAAPRLHRGSTDAEISYDLITHQLLYGIRVLATFSKGSDSPSFRKSICAEATANSGYGVGPIVIGIEVCIPVRS